MTDSDLDRYRERSKRAYLGLLTEQEVVAAAADLQEIQACVLDPDCDHENPEITTRCYELLMLR
jgi:hypothetical protein